MTGGTGIWMSVKHPTKKLPTWMEIDWMTGGFMKTKNCSNQKFKFQRCFYWNDFFVTEKIMIFFVGVPKLVVEIQVHP